MKKVLSFLLAFSMVLGSIGTPVYANEKEGDFEVLSSGLIKDETLAKQDDDNEEVEIPSWNLKRAILLLNEVITVTQIDANKEIVDETPVTRRMIRRIARLSPEQCGAHDLKEWQIKVNNVKGLEFAENMTWLSLVYQNLNDFTPIKENVKLKHLDIRDCSKDGKQIEDISFLSKLTDLDFLNIKAARPKDLTPLKGLIKLTYLDMESTKIENVDFAKDLEELEYFNAQHSFVKDITPFKNHTKLKTLLLSAPANKYFHGKDLLTDISAVSTLKNLKELDISNHNVEDISSLKGLENLEGFTATNNLIKDLEVLLSLPKLNKVWVQGNPAYPGYETSENTFKEAKEIYNSLNKETLTKDDIATLKKLENESDGVKAFFKKSTLETLKRYLETLKSEDSVENKAFENIGVTPGEPETPGGTETPEEPGTDPEVKEKKIIEVMPSGEFTVEKGTNPRTVLPKIIKVKLADAGIITKDEEAKIGTFRRNFKDDLEFGPISIAYKVVDENGKILSSKENPNLIKAVDKNEAGVEYTFNSVGDYFEYVTEDSTRFFNVEINSDKYELDGVYSFKQEPCPIHKEGTIGEVVANDKKADRKEANKEPELFYVIHVKEKPKTENPKLGINNIGISRTNETITYKVVDHEGNIISAKDNPDLLYARDKNSNSDYDKYPKADGDYYTIESAGESIEYELNLKSNEYEMIGSYEFGTDYNQTTYAGYITKVSNTNTNPTYYKLPGANPGEEVFIIKLKPKGEEDPGQTPTPDPSEDLNPNPGEEPTPDSSEKLGYVDGKVVFKLIDEKGNQLKSSEVANDIKVVLDEFKNLEVDGDFFTHKITEVNGATYKPLTIESEKYELVSNNGFKCINFGWTPKLQKVYLDGEEIDITNNDTSKLNAKYFTIVVKEKKTSGETPVEPSPEDPNTGFKYVTGSTPGIGTDKRGHEFITFKVIDENGNQVSAKEYPNLLITSAEQIGQEPIESKSSEDNFTFNTGLGIENKYTILVNQSSKYEIDGEYKFSVKNDASAGWKDIITTVENSKAGEKSYYKVHEDELNENVFIIHVKTKEEGISLNVSAQRFMNYASLSSLPLSNSSTLEEDLKEFKVEWDLSNVKDEVGKYEIEGRVILHEGIVNPQELKAKAVLNVVEKTVELNKLPLQDLVKKAKAEDLTNKTEESKKALEDAIKKADEALTEATTQEELDVAKTALTKAINGLKDKESKPQPKPDNPITPQPKPDEGKPSEPSKPGKEGPSNPSKPIKENDKKDKQKDVKDKSKQDNLTTRRISGENRLLTAIEVSKANFKSADTMILVNGWKEPDALAASALADKEKAPILLIGKDEMISEVKDEIARLGAKKLILVGGENSIADKAVAGLDLEKERIAGANRFETAVEIAKRAGKTDKLVLANGYTLVDALTASALAAKENRGIILVENNQIPEGAREIVENAKDILIVGGKNSVNVNVDAERIAGSNRYETAIKVAERTFPQAKKAALANAFAYSDALVFGAVSKGLEKPILLTEKDTLTPITKDYIKNKGIKDISIIGGINSISEEIFK